MKKYSISAHGCDDSTYIEMELTGEEYATARRIVDEITKAGGGCAPTMAIGDL